MFISDPASRDGQTLDQYLLNRESEKVEFYYDARYLSKSTKSLMNAPKNVLKIGVYDSKGTSKQ